MIAALPVLKQRPRPDEPPEPQKAAVEQMDCRQARGQTKTLLGQPGDST